MKTYREPASSVDKERAYEHVLLNIRREWAGEVRDLEPWGGYEVDPEPLEINDLNGEVLFYEFRVMNGKKENGAVKASASRAMGSPVVTVEFGKRQWDPDKAARQAEKKVKGKYPDAQIEETDIVCYCYPRIGVRVLFNLPESGSQVSIFDVSDMSEVEIFGDYELEGTGAYSFYQEYVYPEAAQREELWNMADKELEMIKEKLPRAFDRGFSARELKELKPALVTPVEPVHPITPIPFYSWRVLRYAPRCKPHNCFELRGQKTPVYCAVATGQMILDFYRYYFTQDKIAHAMHTGPGGTSLSGQVKGYETLSNGCLDATLDTSANWSEAQAEINANRPLKSGIPGHARACAGWKRQNLYLWGHKPQRWLKIYDPWPWNPDPCKGGRVYWENWTAVTHTNFIYVRHRSRPCH